MRRVFAVPVCLLAVFAVCLVALAGTGAAVSAAPGPALELPSVMESIIDDSILREIIEGGYIIVLGDPIVTDVEPNADFTTGGAEVEITGTGLLGATAVTFGGTPATSFTVDSDTKITAVAPMHAPGTVQVMVVEGTKESPDTSADDFTYLAAPTTTVPPTTTAAPATTAPPTTAPPTETTVMETTTIASVPEPEDGGLSGGWIAFIVVIALIVLGGLGGMVYIMGKRSSKGGPAA